MLSHLALANRAMCYVYIVKCVSYNTYIVRAQPQTLLPYTFPIGNCFFFHNFKITNNKTIRAMFVDLSNTKLRRVETKKQFIYVLFIFLTRVLNRFNGKIHTFSLACTSNQFCQY